MIYLSQFLNKPLYRKRRYLGDVVDFIISPDKKSPNITKVLLNKFGKKRLILFNLITFDPKLDTFLLKSKRVLSVEADKKDLYLKEDILDKQVIDTYGKRVVRVNDIVLTQDYKAYGIDIGFAGVLRRLGFKRFLGLKTVILPWLLIETFDYQTGDLKIKLSGAGLNTLHAAEIADILESVGTKERMGVVQSLNPYKAALALEESDKNTQISVIEEASPKELREIIRNLETSEMSEVFYFLNIEKQLEIKRLLGKKKSKELRRVSSFSKNVAGGLMNPVFEQIADTFTLAQTLKVLTKRVINPEAIFIVDSKKRYRGTIYLKDLIHKDPSVILKKVISDKHHVTEKASFKEVLHIFSENRLRVLPVLNSLQRVVGIVSIEDVFDRLEEVKQIHET